MFFICFANVRPKIGHLWLFYPSVDFAKWPFFPELHKETTLNKLWTLAVVNAIFATVSGFIAQLTLMWASHRYHEVTGSNFVEVLNFPGFCTQLQKLRSQLRGFHIRSSKHDAWVSYIKETIFSRLCSFFLHFLSYSNLAQRPSFWDKWVFFSSLKFKIWPENWKWLSPPPQPLHYTVCFYYVWCLLQYHTLKHPPLSGALLTGRLVSVLLVVWLMPEIVALGDWLCRWLHVWWQKWGKW